MKMILNKCFGGFGVSDEGYKLYAQKKGVQLYPYEVNYSIDIHTITKSNSESNWLTTTYFTKDFGEKYEISDEECKEYRLYFTDDDRLDKTLIEVVEELGEKANTRFSDLEVVEIPDGSYYIIDEYDGVETLYYSETEIKNI